MIEDNISKVMISELIDNQKDNIIKSENGFIAGCCLNRLYIECFQNVHLFNHEQLDNLIKNANSLIHG